jgi:hypothetical protein
MVQKAGRVAAIAVSAFAWPPSANCPTTLLFAGLRDGQMVAAVSHSASIQFSVVPDTLGS